MNKFHHFPNRKVTDSIKWNYYPEDVLPLWVADMDFLSAPEIIATLEKRADHGIYGYPHPDDELKEIVVNWVSRQYDWRISTDDLVFLPGVVPGLNVTARAFTVPGESISISTPVYGPFLSIHKNNYLDLIDIPLREHEQGEYFHDFDLFKDSIKPDTKIYYLCNPQNPTGKVYSGSELTDLANICLENDIIICSDEIHCDLVFSGNKHIPIASLSPEISRKTITLIAPSKTFNIAGLKASVAIITDRKIRNSFQQAMSGLVGWVNIFGIAAMKAAYTKCDAWLNELLIALEDNRNYLFDRIETIPGLSMNKPQGTYLAWIKSSLDLGDQKPSDFLLENANVALNDGGWFGENGEDFVRLNFGCPQTLLNEALDRIEATVNEFTAK